MKKTIVIANFPRTSDQILLPVLWASTKTYYERNGQKQNDWTWSPCYLDIYSEENLDTIYRIISEVKPDIFAISLYVWNYKISHTVAEWVKRKFPNCLIISGGPHQYFKYDINWFNKNWYIDASLPGDSYGEICFKEILDNYNNGSVDWNQVTDIRYPKGISRIVTASQKVMHRKDKKHYDYDYAPYAAQFDHLNNFVEAQRQITPTSKLLALLETTRGCPYGCTYCDWGGGINTTVIKRSLNSIQQDITVLKHFYLDFLYIGDANFGIFEDRDVQIIKMLTKKPFWSKQKFEIGYGGFAKTENRLGTIKQIVELDVKAGLSQQKEIKISIQTLDAEVLKNIDRKNISLDKQLEALYPIAKNNKLPIYVEIILGLPGMTLEKFYTELDVLGQHRLSIQFYEWMLLPESPAYARDYRDRFGIQTVDRLNGWSDYRGHGHETIVVGAKSFSTDDYLQMLLSSSVYKLLVQGGFYKNTINYILQNLQAGQLIKLIIEDFYFSKMHQNATKLQANWQTILNNPNLTCQVDVHGNRVYIGWYFVALAYFEHDNFATKLIDFLQNKFAVPEFLIAQDNKLAINSTNFGNYKIDFPYWYNTYNGYQNNIANFLSLFQCFDDSGKIFQAKKQFLNFFKN